MLQSEEHKRKFKELHKGGLKGLWAAYNSDKQGFRWSFWISSITSVSWILFLRIANLNSKKLLSSVDKLVEVSIGIDAAILGLSLAGFVLMITFGSNELMARLIKTHIKKVMKENKHSYSTYQTSLAKFGWAVFTSAVGLVLTFFIRLIIEVNITCNCEQFSTMINLLAFSLVSFFTLYPACLMVQMVINIFTVSQMNHGVIFTEAYRKQEVKENEQT